MVFIIVGLVLYSCRDGGVLGFSYRIRMRVSLVISVLSFWFSSFSCLICWQVCWQLVVVRVVDIASCFMVLVGLLVLFCLSILWVLVCGLRWRRV